MGIRNFAITKAAGRRVAGAVNTGVGTVIAIDEDMAAAAVAMGHLSPVDDGADLVEIAVMTPGGAETVTAVAPQPKAAKPRSASKAASADISEA